MRSVVAQRDLLPEEDKGIDLLLDFESNSVGTESGTAAAAAAVVVHVVSVVASLTISCRK